MPDLVEVLKNALSLDVRDRAALAERLLASLEELSEEEAECLWAEEAQRRLEEYRSGRAKATPAETVHEQGEQKIVCLIVQRLEYLPPLEKGEGGGPPQADSTSANPPIPPF